MELTKTKFRSKFSGNIVTYVKKNNCWVDTQTGETLYPYQVYKQISLFSKIK